ncbi:hypothetical protein [Rhodopirellula sp. MGV]|uniref:hypothetical protein n=1 Tax=Rhodopirellula sp. MGV TaxID=2023130 RepID=UPI000B962DBD|nr:hypothetical protein [Rhodopirellula sp. MGV]OYP35381.1 hypothetical protein CGZ80_11975 [Rhodopirellula sp. MGV]PNY37730.1 hypothetical protein C2E31_06240 [Rhodopirellula baltica]
MKPGTISSWCVVLLLVGWMNPIEAGSETKPQDGPSAASLTPEPGSEKDVECQVLDMSTGAITKVKGRQCDYMSGEIHWPGATPHNYPMTVTAFSYEDMHWIGMAGDIYIDREGSLSGLATLRGGFSWLDNLANNREDRSLAEEMAAFRTELPMDDLIHAFLRKWVRDIRPGESNCWIKFSDVIPKPYLGYLLSNPLGSASIARAKFVTAVKDGELLKVTVSDQTDVMSPSIWIDLDTRKPVKAEGYVYDPDAKDRELKRRLLKSIGIGD